jgi:dTDP-glucose 4,6-dehydratase
MTLLVTGCAGFIGSNFVHTWLSSSDEMVVNLDKLTYAGNLENLKSLDGDTRHVFVQGILATVPWWASCWPSTSRARC